jgi:hypothetical protein
MVESPQNQQIDPDEPTEATVKQTLVSLPTLDWEGWLGQNGFTRNENFQRSADEWNRNWPQHGRGWRLRVAPALDTVHIIVIFSTLSRVACHLVSVGVSERSVIKVVSRVITEIERPVSDATKKRRILAFTRTLHDEPVVQQEARPICRPIPDDPDDLNPEQMSQMLDRLRARCFQKGQRVRIRSPRHTRLNGEMGTVVDAGPHSCYVAVDSYVEANDPDPFRFEEHELEPVFESTEDVDAPEPYMAALDYLTPLKQLGYSASMLDLTYRKSIRMDQRVAGFANQSIEGYLRIIVHPKDARVIVYIDYQSGSERERIISIEVDALEVIDVVRELEQLAAQSQSACEYADKLRQRDFPKSLSATSADRLCYLFGESAMEPDDPDDPKPYFQELQRHAEVINVFRDHGVRMRRRWKQDHPYYAMFWVPNAVEDVSYDILLEPSSDHSWSVTAKGLKEFHHDIDGDVQEEFDIEGAWIISAGATGEELLTEVDNILHAISSHKGPEEPTLQGPDVDDIDEGVDDEIDFEKYAKDSAGYNPVQLLTAKELRKIARDAGYRVNSCYHSKRTTGYSLALTPGNDERFRSFQDSPDGEAIRMEQAFREGIIARLPVLGKIEHGMYNLDAKLDIHCWPWSGLHSAVPEDPHNYVLYVDVQPEDANLRGPGGVVRETVDEPSPEHYLAKISARHCPACQADLTKPRSVAEYFERPGGHEHNEYKIHGHYGNEATRVNAFVWDDRPDRSLAGYTSTGRNCEACGAACRRIGEALDGLGEPEPVTSPPEDELDAAAYAMDTLVPDNTLRELGYALAREVNEHPHWRKQISDKIKFVVFINDSQLNFTFQVYESVPSGEFWQLRGSFAGTDLRKLKASLMRWEQRAKDGMLLGNEPGGVGRLVAEGLDDPDLVLQTHKPKGYALYGQYANYDAPISFSTFKTLPEAVAAARQRDLCNDYDYVWADELEFNSLEKWDLGETMACKYTGIKYRITSEYETERVEHPDAVSGAPPVAESADDVGAEAYAKTTFDPVEFLRSDGWANHSEQHYTYYAKTFKMPRPYQLGGMVFTGVQVRIGIERNLFNQAAVGIYFVDDQERGFGVQGCALSRQTVYPWNEADYDTPPESFFDNGMSIRRFARGIEKVIQNAAWPEKREASLVASSAVKVEVDRFVKALNQQAEVPLYPDRPVEEAVVN